MAKLNKKFSELKGATQKKLIAKYGSKAKAMAAHSAARTLEGKKKNPYPSKDEKKAALKIVSDDNKVVKSEANALLQMGIKPKKINKFVESKPEVNYSKKAATTVSSSAKNKSHAQAALSLTKSGKTEGSGTDDDKTTDPKTTDPKTTDPKTTDPKTTDPKTTGTGGKDTGGKGRNLSFGQFEVPEKYDKNYDPFSEIEYPEAKSGKDFKKYKNQRGKILSAAEADLANKRNRDFKPKVIGKAAKERAAFLGDPSKKPKNLTGRAKRQYKLDQIGKAKKPDFEKFERRIGKIREGKKIEDSKGKERDYTYSGKFEQLGKKLGIKYGKKARKKRTEDRFASLTEGLKSERLKKTYEDSAESSAKQQRRGRRAMKLFRGESVA